MNITLREKPGRGSKSFYDRTFFGHPFSMSTVFGIELWERFSFYSLTSLMVGYLSFSPAVGGIGYPLSIALSIVGAFQALPYLTPAIWGWVADQILGREKTLFLCAFVVLFGHISLGLIPGKAGLALGLLLVGFGSGGVKSATQSMVSSLYDKGDSRLEAAFSLYYLGVNIGALIGPILMGPFHQYFGFHFAFSTAAVGMAIGMVHYSLGRKTLPPAVRSPTSPLPRKVMLRGVGIVILGLALIAILVNLGFFPLSNIASIETVVIILIAIGYFIYLFTSPKVIAPQEKNRIIAYIPVYVVSVVFWALYQQQFNVLQALFNSRAIKHIFGFKVYDEWFQFINPAFIIILTPILTTLWLKLGKRNPPEVLKIGVGVILTGIVFLCMAFLPQHISVLYFLGLILCLTVAELILAPVGMTLTGKLAPRAYPTQMVILFLLIVSLGSSLTGVLSQFYNPVHPMKYFISLGIIAMVAGVIYLVFSPRLGKFIHRNNLSDIAVDPMK